MTPPTDEADKKSTDPLESLIEDPQGKDQQTGTNQESPSATSNPGQPTSYDPLTGTEEAIPEDKSSFWFPSDLITEKDNLVTATNPSVIKSIIPYSLGMMLVILALYLLVRHLQGLSDQFVNNFVPLITVSAPSWWVYVPLTLLAIGSFAILAEWIRRKLTWYIVTEDKILVRRGILFRQVSDFNAQDITKVSQSDPIILRNLGVGHILIYTASTDESEATLDFVQSPTELRRSIRQETNIESSNDSD